MIYYLYKTTNIINNKIYIGIHKTNKLNDGYIGCGIFSNINSNTLRRKRKSKTPLYNAVLKYGIHNFKKEILKYFNTYEEALKEERNIVNEKWIKSNLNYNVALGGSRGCEGWKMPNEQKLHLSNIFKNRYCSDETKVKMSIAMKGISKSKEHRIKLSISKTKYDLKKVYLEIKPLLENNYSESKIINITKYSKGTIYRAKKIANLLNE